MNKLSLVFLVSLTGPYLIATAQPVGTFALWDGKESVAEYAKRTKLRRAMMVPRHAVDRTKVTPASMSRRATRALWPNVCRPKR